MIPLTTSQLYENALGGVRQGVNFAKYLSDIKAIIDAGYNRSFMRMMKSIAFYIDVNFD